MIEESLTEKHQQHVSFGHLKLRCVCWKKDIAVQRQKYLREIQSTRASFYVVGSES